MSLLLVLLGAAGLYLVLSGLVTVAWALFDLVRAIIECWRDEP